MSETLPSDQKENGIFSIYLSSTALEISMRLNNNLYYRPTKNVYNCDVMAVGKPTT
jgi:hypothetical protein